MSAYLDGSEVGQKTHEVDGAQRRCPLLGDVFAETVAVPVRRAARCRVALRVDGQTDRPTVSLQHDVERRRADVVMVVVQIQRERQQRVVAQSTIAEKLLYTESSANNNKW